MNTQITSTDLQQKIQGYIESLALETDQARKSEEMQKYLNFIAKFHNYSPTNIFLIMLTRPDATMVAGFQAWNKMGRYVKKGEHGIPIFAPMIHKQDPDNDDSPKMLSGFRVVYVFDVSQTDGEPLPPVPDWKSLEKNAGLNAKLLRFAESKGITVTFKELPGETQGVSKGGAIEISPNAGTKTLIHEIAHELMHRSDSLILTQKDKEMEAEAVAYSVASFFGLKNLKCSTYLGLFEVENNNLILSLRSIQITVAEIINGIEGGISKEV